MYIILCILYIIQYIYYILYYIQYTLEIDFFKCVLKIVIALCWLIYLSIPLEIRLNFMILK